MRSRQTKTGFSLIEVTLVLVIVAVVFVNIAQFMASTATATRATIAAQKIEQISEASLSYMSARKSSFDAFFAANPAQVVTVPVAKQSAISGSPTGTAGFQSLQEAGFLPPGFIDSNPAGQNHVLLVRSLTGGRLDGLVTAIRGEALPDKDLGLIASKIGASGGAVFSSMTTTPMTHVVGTFSGWSYAIANWSGSLDGAAIIPAAGRPAVSLSMYTSASGPQGAQGTFLSRVATANPAETTMATGLNMGGQPISNASRVEVNGTIGSTGQIDSQRYVWSKEGIFTEGHMWSRNGLHTEGGINTSTWLHSEGGIGTHGPIWAPRGNVNALNFCDQKGQNCINAADLGRLLTPRTCTRETTITGGGEAFGNSCWPQTNYPPPPCPAGYQSMGEHQKVCSYTSAGNPIMTWYRNCERITCQ
jgi:prepilin-type N-terminal cleavage/methylation domain-containing protein